MTLLTLHPRTP